ncbi:hypothetical protein PV08_09537 [Exophiala spinifera]|uniref:F-box domain-containing protein n=1 Tax=Exophiala spinifera TaxID=91928 RepID=A0A0D1YBF1_9EURO|nr:uncharacterized protein PV08_09537 [Exophiala spinifera]KIW12261.1 hypothetical protein PV08_09537 [Exophiala spinifera]
MAMQHLAPEIMVHIYESLTSVSDIINLSLTCHYFHDLLPKSQKLSLFFGALDKEMGPLDEILQLLTQNDNQMLHVRRSPTLSFALLTQAAAVGRTAERLVMLYPSFRWTEAESMSRRFLDAVEARRLRRAVYRFWSYTQAFHGRFGRVPRFDIMPSAERMQLLRTWPTDELCELEDLRCTLEQLLATEICPTDGEVWSRMSDDTRHVHFYAPPAFGHTSFFDRSYPGSVGSYSDVFHSSRDIVVLDRTKPSVQELRHRHMLGWGSDIHSFYLVQSFLKFSPAQILWLYDTAVSKADVEKYIETHTGDPCFFESGSMLFHDWVTVLHTRGVDVQSTREAIWQGTAGIVLDGLPSET